MPYYCMHFSTGNDINISNNGTSVWINDVSKSVIGDVVITTPSVWNDSGHVVKSAMSIVNVEDLAISSCGMNTKIPINAVKYQLF